MYIFVTQNIAGTNLTGTGGSGSAGNIFPLYLYPDKDAVGKTEKRRPNLNADIVNKLADTIKLRFTE